MGKGPRCHTATGGLGMNMGTIKVAVVLSYQAGCGEPAPVVFGRSEEGHDCHYRADKNDECGGAHPVVTDARRRGSPSEPADAALATRWVWATAARSMKATATAR